MDAGKGKSSDFRLSKVLGYRVVQKAVWGDLDFCDLSPLVSPRLKMVSQHTFLNAQDCNRIIRTQASFIAVLRTPPWLDSG